ncbi:uncharacterized protein EDB93DRAFT_815766 [Suillus bovinus]|uniref:uncharacterized protein n=1 Tax=Suillus bovinus TaxID=48563 RepID=UPI001B878B50|nr:uncharacterized protein EDB93DRAFT_815766 [Suillus bovinus]KAG2157791.1 hypothetical protein EDB93DRAFT_815766 [Suillus bovinus]
MSRASPRLAHRPMTRSMTALTVRRSTRLSGVQVHANTISSAPQQQLIRRNINDRVTKISRRAEPLRRQFKHGRHRAAWAAVTTTQDVGQASSTASAIGCPSPSSPHSTTSTSNNVLSARETELIQKENEFRLKSRKLEQQLVTVSQKEREAVALFRECKQRLERTTIRQLEDYFTCPLCFEIILNPRQCGHTFCATCILKWFFSRLHRVCGSWHEPVDCPMCRSALLSTPDNVPRPEYSFPFTPNRTADNAICGMINALAKEADSANISPSSPLADWTEDGHARQEWRRKEIAGRNEMTSLATSWTNMHGDEFIAIKRRLEV